MRTLAVFAVLLLAIPASASIAVFADGRNTKIEAYAVEEDLIHLTLQGGGKMSLPLTRIERIVDDEIVPAEVVEEVKKIVEEQGGVFPKRSWRYSEQSQPLWQSKYNDIIVAAAQKFDVDAALVSAVIKAESDYNPRIVSHKGARGLMQLMPATAKRFGVSNSFDPEENIHAGTRYLRWLLKTFDGNADLAVAAYNAGEGNVWKYDGVPPFRETVNYINRISKHIRKAIDNNVIPSDASVTISVAGASR
ncbi:MAG TPA: lytic transglycosylase domain-containing protein [Thermoanaerobaculia bacterium]|jgi:soluble lytic murein transglycosylase-like protein|nr:lytic transglycosylase domain-containing protein [Thermoanaerobaculia bacterium]